MLDQLLLFFAGLIGGFISGLAGIGTGILLILIIPIALGHMGMTGDTLVKFTLANTVFGTLCSSFMNNITSIKQGRFYPKEIFWTASIAVLCAGILLEFFVKRITYFPLLYNTLITLFLLYILYRGLNRLHTDKNHEEKTSKVKLGLTGLSGGFVAALTGLGGASIAIPMLNVWLNIDIKKSKAIAYGMVFSIAVLLTLLNLKAEHGFAISALHQGYIIFPIALPLSLGVVLGAPIGVFYGERLTSRTISYIFLSFIGVAIIKKLYGVCQALFF